MGTCAFDHTRASHSLVAGAQNGPHAGAGPCVPYDRRKRSGGVPAARAGQISAAHDSREPIEPPASGPMNPFPVRPEDGSVIDNPCARPSRRNRASRSAVGHLAASADPEGPASRGARNGRGISTPQLAPQPPRIAPAACGEHPPVCRPGPIWDHRRATPSARLELLPYPSMRSPGAARQRTEPEEIQRPALIA